MHRITAADVLVIGAAHHSLAAAVALAYADARTAVTAPPRKTTAAYKVQC
ncbi:MAG: hypothetical protein ACRDUB_08560 [Mycobacterium sp.]